MISGYECYINKVIIIIITITINIIIIIIIWGAFQNHTLM